MRVLFTKAWQFLSFGEDGQDLIEWAFLAAFIAIVIVVLLFSFRDPLLGLYQNILDHLNFANGHLLSSP